MNARVRPAPARGTAAVISVAVFLFACTAAPTPPASQSSGASPTVASTVPRGGTLRVILPTEHPPAPSLIRATPPPASVLDPQQEFQDSFSILRCCLTRTLLSHNGQNTEQGGSRLRPDLATDLPEIGADGLTWTFHLKAGLHYGPPLANVEIRAQDFVRSFHRLLGPGIFDYGLYFFGDIEGAAEYGGGTATSISGLEAPDDHTLVVRLTSPNGNLGARMAMPFTAPLPANPTDPSAPFGVAQGHDDGYGRFLVSSGPYILEGSDKLDFSLPAADQQPVAGLVPGRSIALVRNPSWDPASDDLRAAYADRIEFAIGGSTNDALAAFDAGQADVVWNPSAAPVYTPEQVGPYLSGGQPDQVVIDDYDASRGIILNLALHPFDDVHVRKAANYVIDKAALVEFTGGPAAADLATHLVTDGLLDNLLVDYDPYATPGGRGDLEAAKAEMRLSDYDSDGDGRCNGPACAGLQALTRGGPYEQIADSIRDDLASLGIQLDVKVLEQNPFFDSFYDPQTRASMFIGLGWTKSFMSASSFFLEQFYSPVDLGPDFTNGTLVGATRDQLEAWGYEPVDLPNIDTRIEACLPLVGSAQFECWAGLDQYLMEEVAPLVPYVFDKYPSIISRRVVSYSFDQLWSCPAWDRIAVSD
jgi:peptide/nickel transport system substrate-binding protein